MREPATLLEPAPPSEKFAGGDYECIGELGGKGVLSTGSEVALRVGDLAGTSIGEESSRGGGSNSSSSPPGRASVAAIQLERAVFSRQWMSMLMGVVKTIPATMSGNKSCCKQVEA